MSGSRGSGDAAAVVIFIILVGMAYNYMKEYWPYIAGVAAIILLFIIIGAVRSRKRKRALQQRQVQKSAPSAPTPPPPAPPAPPKPEEAAEEPEISIPEAVEGKKLAYHYDDVSIIPAMGAAGIVQATVPLTFSEHQGTVYVLQRDRLIGNLKENRIAGMVRDWKKNGDPVLSYISRFSSDNTSAEIAIFFYRDQARRVLEQFAGEKQYKLTGKPDEFAGGYQPGDACSVEEDLDKEDKYQVIHEGTRIGYLPAAALTYAEDQGISPEDLKVYIADVEYDDERERDIIHVYLSV